MFQDYPVMVAPVSGDKHVPVHCKALSVTQRADNPYLECWIGHKATAVMHRRRASYELVLSGRCACAGCQGLSSACRGAGSSQA